eukprot:425609-Amphidinium_carterae.1
MSLVRRRLSQSLACCQALKQTLARQKPTRLVVGGGDGTVMWADKECESHGCDTTKVRCRELEPAPSPHRDPKLHPRPKVPKSHEQR